MVIAWRVFMAICGYLSIPVTRVPFEHSPSLCRCTHSRVPRS